MGDLGRHISAQAPNPKSRFYLFLLDSAIPVSPLQVEQPLAECFWCVAVVVVGVVLLVCCFCWWCCCCWRNCTTYNKQHHQQLHKHQQQQPTPTPISSTSFVKRSQCNVPHTYISVHSKTIAALLTTASWCLRPAEWIRLSHASHTTTKCQSHASHGFSQPNKMFLGDAQAARLSHEACPAGRQVGGEEGHDQGQGQGLGEVDPSLLALETDLSRVRDLILSRVRGTTISHRAP